MLPVRSAHVRRGILTFAVLAIAATVAVVTAQPPNVPVFDLEEATVADLQKRMEAGQDTARSLVDKYLARIDAVDRNAPPLRRVLDITTSDRGIGDPLDRDRHSARVIPPLNG